MPKIKQSTIDEKYLWIGGGVIVLVLIIFIWGRVSASKTKDLAEINPNITPVTVTTATGNINWDASPLVKEIFTAYNVDWGFGSSRCEALEKISNLQDIQIIALADGYFRTYNQTLRKTITSAWNDGCWSDLTYLSVLKRLDTLQIA